MVMSLEINWNSQKKDEVKKIKFWLNEDKVLIWEMWAWFTDHFAVKRTLSSLVTSTNPCGLSRKLCHEEHVQWAGEMSLQISAFTAPAEDPSWVPSNHITLLSTICNSSSHRIDALSAFYWQGTYGACAEKHKHLNKNKIRNTFQLFLSTVDETI